MRCKRIQALLGIDSFETAIPFLKLSVTKIHEVGTVWRTELKQVRTCSAKYDNRMDYLQDKLKVTKYA